MSRTGLLRSPGCRTRIEKAIETDQNRNLRYEAAGERLTEGIARIVQKRAQAQEEVVEAPKRARGGGRDPGGESSTSSPPSASTTPLGPQRMEVDERGEAAGSSSFLNVLAEISKKESEIEGVLNVMIAEHRDALHYGS